MTLVKLKSNDEKDIYDLTEHKNSCIDESELEEKYQIWLEAMDRDGTMDDYGNLMGLSDT